MTQRVVLVGAGHAHVQVLERWIIRAPRNVELTLLTDRTRSIYSGMVPGLVAGQYAIPDLEIDVATLAERAGAGLVIGTASRIDADGRRIIVQGHDPISYDIASLNVGSTVRGLDVPGVAEHTIPTRPIDGLIEALRQTRRDGVARVVVVGAGAGGVELALAIAAPGRVKGLRAESITVVDGAGRALAAYPASVSRKVHQILDRRGIELRLGIHVTEVQADRVRLQPGGWLDADVVVWAAGAAAHPFLRSSDLPVDVDGFVQVSTALHVLGHQDLLAAGDCASYPRALPKAGVFAVRQGPVLYDNIVALVEGRSPRAYHAQGDYLTILNLGDGTAMGVKWGVSVQGRCLHWVKDRIDRKFIGRFYE